MREVERGLRFVNEIGGCAGSQRRRRRQSFSYKSSLRCWELIYIRDSAVLFITNSLKMNRDPATETVVENNRQGIVALGPVQPRTITFPSSGSMLNAFAILTFCWMILSPILQLNHENCRCESTN